MYLTGRLRAPLNQRGFALLLMTGRPGPLVGPVQICTEQNGDTLFALLASVALLSLEIKRLRRQHFVENPVSSALYTSDAVYFSKMLAALVAIHKDTLSESREADSPLNTLPTISWRSLKRFNLPALATYA